MTENEEPLPQWDPTRKERLLFYGASVLFFVQAGLCIFFYKHLGSSDLLILGWLLVVLGVYANIRARDDFKAFGQAQEEQSFYKTETIVNQGIYGVIRHPMYFSFMLIDLGLVAIAQHWISAVLAVPVLIYLYSAMLDEERLSTKKFGEAYQDYMQRVPRINILLGLLRARERKNKERSGTE